MRLVDYLDKGASLGAGAPCLTTDGRTSSTRRCGSSASASRPRWTGTASRPGDKVAILSANDPVAFTLRVRHQPAGAVWCPVNPRNEAAENRELLALFDCSALIFQAPFAPLVRGSGPTCPAAHAGLPGRRSVDGALTWDEFLGAGSPGRSTGAPSTTSR